MKNKKAPGTTEQSSKKQTKQQSQSRRRRKVSEYGRQLEEKQKVRRMIPK